MLTRDGKKVVTVAEESTAMVWDMATGKCLFCLPHTHRVQEAAVSGCGKMVATVSADNDIWVWDLDTGERIQQLTVSLCSWANFVLPSLAGSIDRLRC